MSNASSSPAQSSLSLTVQDGKITASSREVARVFGKKHYHVIRDIQNLDCSQEFKATNFGGLTFHHQGNEYPYYEMTRDGFTFLAMGFTGQKSEVRGQKTEKPCIAAQKPLLFKYQNKYGVWPRLKQAFFYFDNQNCSNSRVAVTPRKPYLALVRVGAFFIGGSHE